MTGELLHRTVLPVLPDMEDGFVEPPVINDICIDYDGRRSVRGVIARQYDVSGVHGWIHSLCGSPGKGHLSRELRDLQTSLGLGEEGGGERSA